MMSKKRDFTWDIVRGIGILSVVMGHCLPYPYIVNFIYLWHMGLFFFVSGYFLKPDPILNRVRLLKWIIHKLGSLYVPMVVINLVMLCFQDFCVAHNMAHVSYHDSGLIVAIVKSFTFGMVDNPMIYPLWFLRSLFVSSLIVYLIVSIIKNKHYQIFFMFSIYVLALVLNKLNINLPAHFNRELICSTVLFLGFLHCKYNMLKVPNKGRMELIVPTVLLLILSSFVRIDANSSEFSFPFVFQITTILGVLMCMGMSGIIMQLPKTAKILAFIGRNSLYILMLHLIAFKPVSLLIVDQYHLPWKDDSANLYNQVVNDSYPQWWWIIYTIMGTGVPLLSVAIKNIKIYCKR